MTKPCVRKRWKKAQKVEEKSVRIRTSRYRFATIVESWKRVLSEDFSLDFEYFRSKKVLEVGCGSQGMIHCISQPCFRVGIDPLCHNFRDFYARPDRDICVYHITALGENLPFKDAAFDVVIAYNVIDHGMDPNGIIKEISRVLKKGNGALILATNTFSLPKILRWMLWIVDRPHPWHLSNREVRNYLLSAGFRVNFSLVKKARFKTLFSYYLKRGFLSDGIRYFFACLVGMKLSHYICSKDIGGNEANT